MSAWGEFALVVAQQGLPLQAARGEKEANGR